MKSNKDYYDKRQFLLIIGDVSEGDDDPIDDLVKFIVIATKRNRKDSYLLKYLKREKINIPISVIKKVVQNNKKSINGLDAYYGYREKGTVYDLLKNDLVILMRDYRIDQVDLD